MPRKFRLSYAHCTKHPAPEDSMVGCELPDGNIGHSATLNDSLIAVLLDALPKLCTRLLVKFKSLAGRRTDSYPISTPNHIHTTLGLLFGLDIASMKIKLGFKDDATFTCSRSNCLKTHTGVVVGFREEQQQQRRTSPGCSRVKKMSYACCRT
jgi:hypothetical protein